MYDIAFREEDTLAGARGRAISNEVDPEGVNTTVYVEIGRWKMSTLSQDPTRTAQQLY